MTWNWIIYDNHLALACSEMTLHLNAVDIYKCLNNGSLSLEKQRINVNSPEQELPEIRFSKLGSNLHAKVYTNSDGIIQFQAFTIRKGVEISVDIVEGCIIDQCVANNTWFFVTGNVSTIQDVIAKARIQSNGKISFSHIFLYKKVCYLKIKTLLPTR